MNDWPFFMNETVLKEGFIHEKRLETVSGHKAVRVFIMYFTERTLDSLLN